MLKFLGVLLLIILIFLGGYFTFSYYKKNPLGYLEKPRNIIIGWIGPLTGEAKVLGIDNLKAVKLAFSEYKAKKTENDPELTLVVADDKYDAKQSLIEYRKMVDASKPVAIIISTYSGVKALAADALKNSIILIDPIDNDLNLASLNTKWKANIFLIAKETEGLAAIDASAIIAQNKKNTVVLYYGDDDFMPTLANALSQIIKNQGKSQVQLFMYNRGTTDFSKFLKWGLDHRADSYVFFGYSELGYAMKQARDMGITAPFYSVNVITDPAFQTNSKGAINGTQFAHFTTIDGVKLQANEFLEAYLQTYHEYPAVEWTAMQAYDASNILIQAIKEAYHQEGDFVANLYEVMRKITDYSGVSGVIRIKSNGSSQGIYPSLYILQNGKAIPITNTPAMERTN